VTTVATGRCVQEKLAAHREWAARFQIEAEIRTNPIPIADFLYSGRSFSFSRSFSACSLVRRGLVRGTNSLSRRS
jgi:hypothetical protein